MKRGVTILHLVQRTGKILMTVIFLMGVFGSQGFTASGSLFSGGEIDTRGQGFTYLGLELSSPLYKSLSLEGSFPIILPADFGLGAGWLGRFLQGFIPLLD